MPANMVSPEKKQTLIPANITEFTVCHICMDNKLEFPDLNCSITIPQHVQK